MYTLHTPAKVNLFLNIRGLRPDGYHELATVLMPVGLTDTLTLRPDDTTLKITFTCNWPALENLQEKNLVAKAAQLFWNTTGLPQQGFFLHLEKKIPMEAGLGGGSSDAAAMLKLLATWHNIAFTSPEWKQLEQQAGRCLGSDVPFFMQPLLQTALATGTGGQITPLFSCLPPHPVVLIHPKYSGVSTPEAYQWVRQAHLSNTHRYAIKDEQPIVEKLQSATSAWETLYALFYNDFEPIIFAHQPAFKNINALWNTLGPFPPLLLCGSGSCFLGVLNAQEPLSIQNIQAVFPPQQYQCFITQLMPTWC